MADVLVLDHDEDMLCLMAEAIESRGFTTATAQADRTVEELAALLRVHDPRVVVYDLGPPPCTRAVEKWRRLCEQPGGRRRYVLTTTYAPITIPPHPCLVESIMLKPLALDGVRDAVERAMK